MLVAADRRHLPLVLRLKELGAEVAVVATSGATQGGGVERHCDCFETFAGLLAARAASGDRPAGLYEIATVLRRVIEPRERVVFAAVRPLLGR